MCVLAEREAYFVNKHLKFIDDDVIADKDTKPEVGKLARLHRRGCFQGWLVQHTLLCSPCRLPLAKWN